MTNKLMNLGLLVIDVQRIYTTKNSALYCQSPDKTIGNINRLIDRFTAQKYPIIYVRHVHMPDGSDLGRMFDFAGPFEDFNFKAGSKEVEYSSGLHRPDGALELVKARYSAFIGTKLDETLKRLGVERVVICGFMTNFCCDSTARDAHDLDYFVDFISDATGTPGVPTMNQSHIRDVVGNFLGGLRAGLFYPKISKATFGPPKGIMPGLHKPLENSSDSNQPYFLCGAYCKKRL